MEPATIVVLALSAGVVALLVWFEINSRRNEARKKESSSLPQPASGPGKDPESKVQSESKDRRAA